MQSNSNRLQRVRRPKTKKREASVTVPKIMLPIEHKHEGNYLLNKQHRLCRESTKIRTPMQTTKMKEMHLILCSHWKGMH